MARPTIYTPDLAEALLQRLEDGESLTSICRDDAMPSKRTVLTWAADREDVAAALKLAREAAAWEFDHQAKELEASIHDRESAIAARARFEILRWRAAVHAPRVFGDRVDVKVEGTVDLAAIIQARGQAAIERRRTLLGETRTPSPGTLLLPSPEAPNDSTDEG